MDITIIFVIIICIINTLTLSITVNGVNDEKTYKAFKQHGRIVGGKTTSISNYPFIVSVQYHGKHICGGSILQSNIILTAAHCVKPFDNADGIFVRAGSSFSNHGGQLVPVLDFIQNPDYNTENLEKDLALLILYRTLIFTSRIQPIVLADKEDHLPIGSKVRVIGWGATEPESLIPAVELHVVTVYVINRTICYNDYKDYVQITNNMLCAANPNGGKDSCQGDSGGPLILPISHEMKSTKMFKTAESDNYRSNQNKGVVKQYGTVSFGVGCANKKYPGVYANIAALRSWIDENINTINSK